MDGVASLVELRIQFLAVTRIAKHQSGIGIRPRSCSAIDLQHAQDMLDAVQQLISSAQSPSVLWAQGVPHALPKR